jgi:hypothetical protein
MPVQSCSGNEDSPTDSEGASKARVPVARLVVAAPESGDLRGEETEPSKWPSGAG